MYLISDVTNSNKKKISDTLAKNSNDNEKLNTHFGCNNDITNVGIKMAN